MILLEPLHLGSMPSRILIVVVLVAFLVLALGLRSRMGEQEESIKVLAALTDVSPGDFVRGGERVGFIAWPEDKITDTMITSDKAQLAEYEGAVVRRAVQKGAPIFKSDLVKSNEGGFMSAVLEPGKRAVSISVDATTGNAGFIFPGDHVDLILTLAVNRDGQQARASETIIEDVRVLAIDQMMGNTENKAVLAKTVTLEVTPRQAEEINVGKDLGKLSLSLRSLASAEEVKEVPVAPAAAAASPATLDDVLKDSSTGSVVEAAQEDSRITRDTDVSKMITPRGLAGSVQVIRGSERQTIQFGEGGSSSDVR